MSKTYTFMIKHTLALLLLLCMLPACVQSHVSIVQPVEEQQVVYDLNDSTDIILQLLKTDDLAKILDDSDPEKIDTLVKNISPALMAFESEVLACALPVLVCFCSKEQKEQCFIWLMELHEQYPNIKYVLVDVDKLFVVAQQAEVSSTPTVLLIKDREEIERFEDPIDMQQVHMILQSVAIR